MNAIIKQPAGLGDIFFCQKIANRVRAQGYKIIWPVIPQFLWIKNYIDNVEFVDANDNPFINVLKSIDDMVFTQFYGDDVVINLQNADKIHRGMSVMLAKYRCVNITPDNWADHFNFKRNIARENELFYDVLGLKDTTQFALKNFKFASPPHEQVCQRALDAHVGDLEEIHMQSLSEFTLLDWCKVLEHATAIHTVETSLNYVIEKLSTTDQLFMYSKWKPSSYYHIDMLFKKPWQYDYAL